MGVVTGLVLYLVIWVVTFMTALPIRIQTQDEAGEIVPGTPAGSPQEHHLKKKAWIATAVAAVIWAIVAMIIINGWITISDIDVFNRMGRP
jgi:predicted secreted protein